jgi:tetratricopeptide (TPR) repeat protein
MPDALFSVDWTGNGALIKGDCPAALKQVLMESKTDDPVYRDFKLGIIYYRLQNYSTALSLLRSVVRARPLLAPVVYGYIAEIESAMGRTGNTLAAYRSVLRGDITPRYRHYIYERLRSIVESDSTLSVEQAPWLEDYYRWRAPQVEPTIYSRMDTLEGYIGEGSWKLIDSLILNEPFSGSDACRLVKSVRTSLPEKVLGVKSLFSCAGMARQCGELTVAEQFLHRVRKRDRFLDTIPERDYVYFFGQLRYEQHEWRDAIKYYKEFLGKFGNDADAMLSIARAYRKVNDEAESGIWYDRLMKAYPRHPKTQEILWLRAWQNEDRDRYERAGNYYRRIYTRYGKGGRVEESYLRHGLCYYNRKIYDSVLVILGNFTDKFPLSTLHLGGYYWQAKACLKLNRKDDAVTILRLVSRKDPFNYYAHRARQVLLELGDTADVLIDTVISGEKILQWFDSVTVSGSQQRELTFRDSTMILCGVYLASVGDVERADFFLEPLELGFPGNLTLQYLLANLYMGANATAQAFRIARRLTWRIPQQFREEMPLEVYKLFYPPFYSDVIQKETKKYKIDPFLISGVMRQESIFNPQIVSPAGAVGLMQIMPYTGKYIAEKKETPFTVDSLYNPFFNIRFGVYYVSELLERFNGDAVLSLAGYNAGPHNAKRWGDENGDKEFDLFVENIGYTETRGYVKKVMANCWTYRYLSRFSSFSYGTSLAEAAPAAAFFSSSVGGKER